MPDQSLLQTLPLAFSSTSPAAYLGWVAERCIRSAPNHLECESCINGCPAQALFFVEENECSVKGQRLVVSDACHGCSACLPSCPTEALLNSELQDLDQRIASQLPNKALEIVCHRVESNKATADTLHCLRVIGQDQLASWMVKSSAQPITLCVAEVCTDCDAAPAKQAKTDEWWKQMQALEVLQVKKANCSYHAVQGALLSRRRFMVASRPQQPVYAQGDAGVRARRLQRYVAALQTKAPHEVTQLPRIQLNQHLCDASGVCSKVCPTEALELTDQGTLMFTPLECINCGFCVRHCPTQALSLIETASTERLDLRTTSEVECFECGRAFSSLQVDPKTHRICPACHREKTLLKEDFSQLFG